MSDTGVDPALLQMILAGNDFGSGPGFLGADSNVYQRADQRLNFVMDLLKSGGIYMDDLLGIPDAPTDPGAAPVYGGFVSDTRNVYQNNPLFAAAFQEIEQGADPVTVARGIAEHLENNPDDAQFAPESFDAFNPGASQQAIQSILTKFAGEAERERRERGEFQTEINQFNTEADAFNRYNNPGTLFDEMGAPTLEEYTQGRLESAGLRSNPYARFLENESRPSGPLTSADPLFGTGQPRPDAPTRLSAINPAGLAPSNTSGGSEPDLSALGTPLSEGPVGSPNRSARIADSDLYSDRRARARAGGHLTREAEELLNKFGQSNLNKARGTVTPSGREKDNKKRLRAAFSLIFGEAPGV